MDGGHQEKDRFGARYILIGYPEDLEIESGRSSGGAFIPTVADIDELG